MVISLTPLLRLPPPSTTRLTLSAAALSLVPLVTAVQLAEPVVGMVLGSRPLGPLPLALALALGRGGDAEKAGEETHCVVGGWECLVEGFCVE